MQLATPRWVTSPAAVRTAGALVLWSLFGLGVAVVLGAVWVAPDALPLIPVLLLGAGTLGLLLRRPLLNLCVTLLAAAVILEHQPGVQVSEVLYGLYALFYLVTWGIWHRFVKGRPILESSETWTLALFLGLVIALVPMSLLHGATPHTIVRELTSLAMIAFFFPIREAVRRSEHGLRALLGVALVLTVFVVVRNVFTYREVLNSAERMADMVAGRVIANEHMLAACSLFGAVFLLYASTARQALSGAVIFLMAFGALLLSMSRGFWVAFAWGVCFLIWAVDGQRRMRIVWMGGLAAIGIFAIATIFFGNFAQIYIEGLLDRISSVGSSTTRDVSMLGRIYEGRAALGHIAENPVLGHGVGAPFTFSTILTRTEITTTFVHNGYIYLWYAFGIPGALLILTLWGRGIGAGLNVFRRVDVPRLERLASLSIAATLFCYTLSAMTSSPFWHKDYLLGLGVLLGLVYGVRARVVAPAT